MEILAEKVIYTFNGYWFVAICCTILAVMCVAIICICEDEPSIWDKIAISLVLILMISFIALGAGYSFNHPVMEYKVRFVEKIDMEEFLDTYEIRDKDGNIITIRCLEPGAPSEEATNRSLGIGRLLFMRYKAREE